MKIYKKLFTDELLTWLSIEFYLKIEKLKTEERSGIFYQQPRDYYH